MKTEWLYHEVFNLLKENEKNINEQTHPPYIS